MATGQNQSAGNPGVAPPQGNQPAQQAKGEFAWKAHAYTNEYIRFADSKAGAVIAWCSALIAGLYSAKVHKNFIREGWPAFTDIHWGLTILGILSFTAFLFLSLSAIAGMLAIWPRLWTADEDEDAGWSDAMCNRIGSLFLKKKPAPQGLIFWESVKTYNSDTAYADAVAAASSVDLDREVAKHVYHLGRVCKAKMFWVQRSVWLAFIGSLIGVIVVLFT